MPNHIFKKLMGVFTVLSMLGIGACKSSLDGSQIQVKDAWGRPSPASASVGAIYMQVQNTGEQDDKLISASSPACAVIEIHETIKDGDTMGMRPVSDGFVLIPAGETVAFKTGGLHLMCIDKLEDFSPGTVIPLSLQFEDEGEIPVEVEIRSQ